MGRRWIRNKIKELKGTRQYSRSQKKKKARARRLNDLEGRFRVEKKEYTTGPRKSASEEPNRTSPGVVTSAIESLKTELELATVSPTIPRSPAHKEPEVIKKDCLRKQRNRRNQRPEMWGATRAINVLARGGDYFLVGGHTIPFSLGVVCKDSRWAYNKRLTKIPVSSRGMNNPFSNLRYIKVDLEKDVLLFSHNTSAFVHLLPDAITTNIKYVGMKAAVCVDGEKEEDTSTVGTEGDCSALFPMTSRPNHHLSWYFRYDDAVTQFKEGWRFHLESPFSNNLGPEAAARGCPPCLRMIMKRCY
ncbi:hypothetical protein HYALB_00007301 [Hymenoscyphus albidus]|uniref:Uncharacterized protein n=1 Tax=Hymenoscyphus albidus TaxID=595503 RepID=A0A9N9M1W6_9HELO|nr:hypothetical protein HYALB_00007301 [Hymenoscyphus albidus]